MSIFQLFGVCCRNSCTELLYRNVPIGLLSKVGPHVSTLRDVRTKAPPVWEFQETKGRK